MQKETPIIDAHVILILVAVTVLVPVVIVFFSISRPWLQAYAAGAPIPVKDMVAMALRGRPAALLVDAYVTALQSGVKTSIEEVERIYVANKGRMLSTEDLVSLLTRKDT